MNSLSKITSTCHLRAMLLTLITLMSLPPRASAADEPLPVFVFAGGSNMSG